MREIVDLVTAGVPMKDAMEMSPTMRATFLIAIGESRGGKFDFVRGEWKKQTNES